METVGVHICTIKYTFNDMLGRAGKQIKSEFSSSLRNKDRFALTRCEKLKVGARKTIHGKSRFSKTRNIYLDIPTTSYVSKITG